MSSMQSTIDKLIIAIIFNVPLNFLQIFKIVIYVIIKYLLIFAIMNNIKMLNVSDHNQLSFINISLSGFK